MGWIEVCWTGMRGSSGSTRPWSAGPGFRPYCPGRLVYITACLKALGVSHNKVFHTITSSDRAVVSFRVFF